jgi:hypothetical protein
MRIDVDNVTSFLMLSQACGLAPQGYSPWTSRCTFLLSVADSLRPLAIATA